MRASSGPHLAEHLPTHPLIQLILCGGCCYCHHFTDDETDSERWSLSKVSASERRAGLSSEAALWATSRPPGLTEPVCLYPSKAWSDPECQSPTPHPSSVPLCVSPQAVEKLVQGAESGCHSEKEKQIVLNCSRLLTRVLPYIFEDPDWRGFFWSTVPGAGRGGVCGPGCGAGWEVTGRQGENPFGVGHIPPNLLWRLGSTRVGK